MATCTVYVFLVKIELSDYKHFLGAEGIYEWLNYPILPDNKGEPRLQAIIISCSKHARGINRATSIFPAGSGTAGK
jgi:hypothetical protein